VTFTIRPVDPPRDAALLHGWVSQERAAYWGMLDKDVEEVEAIYSYVQEQPHLAAYLVTRDDRPLALFQTYDPAVDEIGGYYDRRPGDVGVHLFLADDPARAGLTPALLELLMDWVFADEAHRRIVAEPDARNAKSVALFVSLGAALGPIVQLPNKPAQFTFLTRESSRVSR